jgi:hypothetical protein
MFLDKSNLSPLNKAISAIRKPVALKTSFKDGDVGKISFLARSQIQRFRIHGDIASLSLFYS